MPRSHHFALIGNPVEHSRSPAIHNEALKWAGFQGSYVAIEGDRDGLKGVVNDLRSGDLDGLNVTMPLKTAAFEIADVMTDEAESSQSVNSLRLRDGLVEGHSTDVVAFSRILQREGLRNLTSLLVLGAGGSARAALAVADDRNVYLSSRDYDKAIALAETVDDPSVVRWEVGVAGAIVINATPLGMGLEELPEFVLELAGALIDLPYGNQPTPAVMRARDLGIPIVDGIEFLVTQAVASFQWWTDVEVPSAVLIENARKI